jgi:hypothetical protein
MAEDELRERIKLASDRVKQLINAGWTTDQMITVQKVFLDCFGMFDRMDKDPQSDLYHAVESAFTKVGQYNPSHATMNHRRLSEIQVQTATEFLSDLELYYAERQVPTGTLSTIEKGIPAPVPITGNLSATVEATLVAQAVVSWASDAFICHSLGDKPFVRQLAERLRQHGVRVWFDESELTVGDSIRGKIDEGLKSCEYGIVVFSESFFRKPWPQHELDALFGIQNARGTKVILPVWHDITEAMVRSRSPLLASRMATMSSDGIGKVTAELLRVLRPPQP